MRHRFHSFCPYFAMFPETFVEKWVDKLVRPSEVVLDPFCGRGTSAFQSILMGRSAVACDVNPVAYCVTRAKTNAPSIAALRRRITIIEKEYRPSALNHEVKALPNFFRAAFHRETLRQILHLRRSLRWQQTDVDCMLAALVLGSLHGECNKSRAYMSNQMPRTISPKPRYAIDFWRKRNLIAPERDVFQVLRDRITFRYETGVPERRGDVYWSDMRNLPELLRGNGQNIRHVITSPPYFDITNFEEDQWLRLWFLGNPPHPTYRKLSSDDRHSSPSKYWGMICDFWRVLGLLLGSKGHVVMRLGAKEQSPEQLAQRMLATSSFSGRKVKMVEDYEVSAIKGRQTDSFRPGSKGCLVEVDFHFVMA